MNLLITNAHEDQAYPIMRCRAPDCAADRRAGRILDKSHTLAAAEPAGFPIPRARIPATFDEARRAAREIPPPRVLKPRCNARTVNLKLARGEAKPAQAFAGVSLPFFHAQRHFTGASSAAPKPHSLRRLRFARRTRPGPAGRLRLQRLSREQGRPLMQEFVPPATKRNFYRVVDRNCEALSVFRAVVQRTRVTGLRTHDEPFEYEALGDLLRDLRGDCLRPRRRVASPFNRGCLSDPAPPPVRIMRVFLEALQRRVA